MKNSPKISAYVQQIESGKINTDKSKILKFIMDNNGKTIENMQNCLFMKLQTVVGRVSDLYDMGLIYPIGRTETHSLYVCELNVVKQAEIALKRRTEKFDNWRKNGLNKFGDLIHQGLRNQLNQTSLF